MKLIDITGMTFGKLTVEGRGTDALSKNHEPRWYCRCSCGNHERKLVRGSDLRKDKEATRTCGCGGDGIGGCKNATHGLSHTGAYVSWLDMHRRCYEEENKYYSDYGGRGITVCARWNRTNADGLKNFIEDMGQRKKGFSLERLDFNAGYCPENCKWIPLRDQSRNTRAVRLVEMDGIKVPMADVARRLRVGPAYVSYYLDRGKSYSWLKEHVENRRALGKMSPSQDGWKNVRN